MLTVALAALAVGLSNFAASVAIGLAGVDRQVRLRVAAVFGVFEAGMPLIGLLLGHNLAQTLGRTSRYTGGALLVATGCWTFVHARAQSKRAPRSPKSAHSAHSAQSRQDTGAGEPTRDAPTHDDPTRDHRAESGPASSLPRLLLAGLALSVDNLVVGFSLGITKTPLLAAALIFGIVSIALSLGGLEIGRRLGGRGEASSETAAGVVLVVVGVLIAAGVL
jgi:putative Mn2+ efflux pump MntP